MEQQEYKLNLELGLSAYPPKEPRFCVLCMDLISSTYYLLGVEREGQVSPVYFDEECFNHLLAIGWKLLSERQQELKS